MPFYIHINIEIGRRKEEKTSHESWARLRRIVARRDRQICHYCHEYARDGHVDHIVPLSKGGTDALENLVWACPSCNLSKANYTPGIPPEQDWTDDDLRAFLALALKHGITRRVWETKPSQVLPTGLKVNRYIYEQMIRELAHMGIVNLPHRRGEPNWINQKAAEVWLE